MARSSLSLARLALFISGCEIRRCSAFLAETTTRIKTKKTSPSPLSAFYSTDQDNSLLPLDLDINAFRDVPTFYDWALSSGVQTSEGFELTLTNDNPQNDQVEYENDISVQTTQDVAAQSPVLFVPSHMIISSFAARDEFLPYRSYLEQAEKMLVSLNALDQLPQFYLTLKLLVECQNGVDSPWFPWFTAQPRQFYNGASMTEFCFECLPPLVSKLALQERTNWRAIQSSLQAVDDTLLYPETKANKQLLYWAFQIVTTRSIEAEIDEYDEQETQLIGYNDWRLIPMADMFNHGSSSDTENENDISDSPSAVQVELTHDEEGNCLAYAKHDIPAGSPLRISYADSTNPSFLLARYGFLDETAPATFCKYMIPHATPDIIDMGYVPNQMLFYPATGEVSRSVWNVLLYQILSASNVARKRLFYQAVMDEDEERQQKFHDAYYPQTSAKLLEHIDSFLSELDKLQNKMMTQVDNVEQHPRLPLIWKHNEFVKETFWTVRARYFSE